MSLTTRVALWLFATALTFFWLLVNKRLRIRINYWLDCLARMEPAEDFLITSRVFTGKDSEKIRKPPRIYAVNLLPWMLGFLWMIALAFAIATYLYQ